MQTIIKSKGKFSKYRITAFILIILVICAGLFIALNKANKHEQFVTKTGRITKLQNLNYQPQVSGSDAVITIKTIEGQDTTYYVGAGATKAKCDPALAQDMQANAYAIDDRVEIRGKLDAPKREKKEETKNIANKIGLDLNIYTVCDKGTYIKKL